MLEDIPKCGERSTHTIVGIWTKIVITLRTSLGNIKGDTQHAKLQLLKFHAKRDKGGF